MRPSLALLLLSMASSTAAQVPPDSTGRFATRWDRRAQVDSSSGPALEAFRSSVHGFAARTVALPAVNQPPAPYCMRASSWFNTRWQDERAAGLTGAFELLRPTMIGGVCRDLLGGGIRVSFNAVGGPLRKQYPASDGESEWFRVYTDHIDPTGFTAELDGDSYEIMTHAHAPLLRPVSIERYWRRRLADETAGVRQVQAVRAEIDADPGDFERWKREDFPAEAADIRRQFADLMRQAQTDEQRRMLQEGVVTAIRTLEESKRIGLAARLEMSGDAAKATSQAAARTERIEAIIAALSPAERRLQACATVDGPNPFVGRDDCTPRDALWEINPAYYDPTRPGAVQAIVLETPTARYLGETAEMESNRRAIWQALDRDSLRGMIR